MMQLQAKSSNEKLHRSVSLGAVLVLVGCLGSWLVLSSKAATSPPSVEPESGAVLPPAGRVSDTTASDGSAIKFGNGSSSGGSSSCPAYPAHPDASCTGVRVGVTLQDNPLSILHDGGTFSGIRFTGSGTPTITNSNITFIDCSFPNGAIFRSGTTVNVSHSDFGGDVYFSSSHTVTFNNNNIHDFGDGLDVTSDAGSMASNITLRENWVHHPIAQAPDHADGSQIRGVSGLSVIHNTLDMGVWYTDNGTNVLNSALFFEDANGGNTGIVATNNYLNGAGYTLYAPGGVGSITNNTFGPDDHFGYVYGTVNSGFTRSGNIDSQGHPVNF